MKTVTITLAMLLGLLLGQIPTTALAWWNPFVKKDEVKNPARSAILRGGSLSPAVSKKYRDRHPNPPSMPKKIVNETVDTLTLKPLRQKIKGSHWGTTPTVSNTQMKKPSQPSKPSFLGSLFKPKEPQQPRTVEEWLVQKRPPFK